MTYYLFYISLEIALKQSIGLVHDKKLTIIEKMLEFFCQLFQATWSTHYKLNIFILYFCHVLFHHCSTYKISNIGFSEFTQLLGQSLSLQGQFSSRYKDDPLNSFLFLIDLIQNWDEKSSSFPGTILRPCNDTFSGHNQGDRLLLDGCGNEISTLGKGKDDFLP